MRKFWFLLIVLACVSLPHARLWAFHIDGNLFYFSDSFKSTATTTATYMATDASININLDKRGGWAIGWSYLMISTAQKTTGNSTFAAADMGPRVSWFMNKSRTFGLGVVYNLIANTTYKGPDGGNTLKWRGTSIKADIGYSAQVNESMSLGMRINYYSAQWNEQLVGAEDFSKITYARGWIYPSVYFRWDM